MVIRGDGQRPAARDSEVLLEKPRRRNRCAVWIESFIDDVVDAHETATRRARELPETGCADALERAHGRVRDTLSSFEPPALDPATDGALLEFIDRKKASMPDAWY